MKGEIEDQIEIGIPDIEMMIEEGTEEVVEIGVMREETGEGMKMIEEVGGTTEEIDDEVLVLEEGEMKIEGPETVMRIEEGEMQIDLEIVVRIGGETIENSRVKELKSPNGEKMLLPLKLLSHGEDSQLLRTHQQNL